MGAAYNGKWRQRQGGGSSINCALCPTTSVPGASVMGAGGERIGVMGGKICDINSVS